METRPEEVFLALKTRPRPMEPLSGHAMSVAVLEEVKPALQPCSQQAR